MRLANVIVNTCQLVHARVEGAREAGGERSVVLVMTSGPEIELVGENADKFLTALPIYEPVAEEG